MNHDSYMYVECLIVLFAVTIQSIVTIPFPELSFPAMSTSNITGDPGCTLFAPALPKWNMLTDGFKYFNFKQVLGSMRVGKMRTADQINTA
jgi:hypothetical protein